LRAVLDTAILVRAHPRATGPAKALLDEIVRRNDHLVGSESILRELDCVMRYPRILRQSRLSSSAIDAYLRTLRRFMRFPRMLDSPTPPISDLDDAHVIQAAICRMADFLCTLDKHFFEEPVLAFCADRGITVITDVDLLNKIRQ
jgi:predicted nucleic acid-binding protein